MNIMLIEEDQTEYLVLLNPHWGITIYTGDSRNPTYFQEIAGMTTEESACEYMKRWVSIPWLRPNIGYPDGSQLYRVFDRFRLETSEKMTKEEQLEKLKEFQAKSETEVLKVIWDGAIKTLPILPWDRLSADEQEHFRRTMRAHEDLLRI